MNNTAAGPGHAPRPVRHKDLPATLYGIRHHGPGSARSVRAALAEQCPDIVLIEGPPEADGLVALAADEEMRPPVALLGYVPGEPQQAAFWPFAVFSPEWQAIGYALRAGVPVRFCDLPAAHQLAMTGRDVPSARTDPVAELATAAGYDDPERWWEDVVEHVPGSAVFDALAEAIGILRADAAEPDPRDAIREAHMRKVLRRTVRDGFERIAVVCGAWHVPALRDLPPAVADDRLLRGLPKAKASLTWVPWTYGRLSYASGYGAGIRSPGWYDHLFCSPGQPVERWLAKAAAVLRDEGIPASPAHVIESVRLAEALAALRGRPLAGLEEVTEAAHSVLCEGSDLLTALIQRRLVVGERLGTVPPATPMVPLQRDLQDQQRHLRLRPEAEPRDYDLDLRKPNDLARSRLLYRLALLQVAWGTPQQSRTANIGTFRESWQLTWRPELDLALIEASMWGSTVAAAAAQRARSIAADATALNELTALAERCPLADLGDALPAVLAAVRDRAALEGDVTHLMAALPAVVRAARYGDVRGTDPTRLGEVAIEMITRICAGLPVAVASLDETAEQAMRERIDAVNSATGLLVDGTSRDRWLDTLAALARGDDPPRPPRAGMAPRCPPLISGRLTRLLLDAGRITTGGGCPDVPRTVRRGPRPGRRGLGRGVPGRQRPAARPRRQAPRPGGRLAGRAERGRLHRRAARAAADVRRVRATGTAGDRAAGRAARRQRPPSCRRRVGHRRPRLRAGVACDRGRGFDSRAHPASGIVTAGHDERMRRWRLMLGEKAGMPVPLGGGDVRIDAALIFILISDLFEGGDRDEMLRRIADVTAAGTQVIALLALSDDGAPGYDHENAAALAGLGVTAFACTPDAFGDLMAAAIERRHRARGRGEHRRVPEAGAQDERVRPG